MWTRIDRTPSNTSLGDVRRHPRRLARAGREEILENLPERFIFATRALESSSVAQLHEEYDLH